MRIIETGARSVLMNRIQCMRDVNSLLDDAIDELIQSRGECCGYSSSSSSSSSGSSSNSSSSSEVILPSAYINSTGGKYVTSTGGFYIV